jgi:ABC-2 type transport system ATP-binding protein
MPLGSPIATHYLDEADQLAERVVVIDHGRIIADDTPARLKASYAGDRITLTFEREEDVPRGACHSLGIAAGAQIEQVGASVVVQVDGGAGLAPRLLRSLDDASVAVASVEVTRPTLDDVFLNLTGRSLREDGTAAIAPGEPEPISPQEILA